MTPIAARLLTARGASKPIPTPFRSDQAFAKDFKEGPPVSGIGRLMPSRLGKPKHKAGVRHKNSFFRHM